MFTLTINNETTGTYSRSRDAVRGAGRAIAKLGDRADTARATVTNDDTGLIVWTRGPDEAPAPHPESTPAPRVELIDTDADCNVDQTPTAETLTIDAFGLGETMTLTVPADWHDRIKALEDATCFGPAYVRAVVDELRTMSDAVRQGYTEAAEAALARAEDAARTPESAPAEVDEAQAVEATPEPQPAHTCRCGRSFAKGFGLRVHQRTCQPAEEVAPAGAAPESAPKPASRPNVALTAVKPFALELVQRGDEVLDVQAASTDDPLRLRVTIIGGSDPAAVGEVLGFLTWEPSARKWRPSATYRDGTPMSRRGKLTAGKLAVVHALIDLPGQTDTVR